MVVGAAVLVLGVVAVLVRSPAAPPMATLEINLDQPAIVSVDGKSAPSAGALAAAVAGHRPGGRLVLGTIRKGHERTVNVTLANAPRNAT